MFEAFDVIMKINGKMTKINWLDSYKRFKSFTIVYLNTNHISHTFNELFYNSIAKKQEHFRQYVLNYFRKMARLESNAPSL